MAKITLDTITSAYGSASLFQSNFAAIATELNDKVLYRVNPVGEANQMMNDLDMNSNDILNVDALDTTSLTVNGTAITPNTNDQTLTYIDTEFTTQAGQDTFLAAYTVGFVDVYLNGVLLANADYAATNGTSVVLTSVVALDTDVITIRAFSAFSAGDGITQTTADARYLLEANNLSDLNSVATARTNLGLGDSALTTEQTSTTDATAGRGLIVGAGGLLVPVFPSAGTDIDTLRSPTSYAYYYSDISGPRPSDMLANARGTLEVKSLSTSYVYQVITDCLNGGTWNRTYNGAWSAWQPVYTGANYQPETYNGIGSKILMKSSVLVLLNDSTAAGNVLPVWFSTGGVLSTGSTSAVVGTWKNVSGKNIAINESGYFVRIA